MLTRKERIARRRAIAVEIERFLADGDARTVDLVLSVVGLRCNLIADDVASTLSSLHGQGVVTIDFVTSLVKLRSSRSEN